MDIKKQLISTRKSKGLSQSALAKKIGMSASQVRNIEKGRCEPTMDFLRRFSYATNTSLIITFIYE